MAKKTCTCQQTPADPERRYVGDMCVCEAKAMTVREARERLKACGYSLGLVTHEEIPTLTGHRRGWRTVAFDPESYREFGKGRTRADALTDLVARVEAKEAKR